MRRPIQLKRQHLLARSLARGDRDWGDDDDDGDEEIVVVDDEELFPIQTPSKKTWGKFAH